MSVSYTWVGWNAHKRRYDAAMLACVTVYLAGFVGVTMLLPGTRNMSLPIVLIRALGTCALVMLHVALAIGPLARLSTKFAPLLYNRRHLGVLTFCIGAAHLVLATVWYHGFGTKLAPASVLASNPHYESFTMFPFEVLGVLAAAILFVMAATSHDFWLKNLSARTWKNIHMLVYSAYALLVLHVALGALQLEKSLVYPAFLGIGALALASLHIAAGLRERRKDAPAPASELDGWIDAGELATIPQSRARVVCAPAGEGRPGERIAVYNDNGTARAISNVCAHQGGPLGEGKIIGGCVTCPWHGYQYEPVTGCSPPPFTERVAKYEVRVSAGRVFVNPSGKLSSPRAEGAGHA